MDYEVRVIADDDLPAEVDWLFVRRGECLSFCLKESAGADAVRLEAALTAAWSAERRIFREELLDYPAAACAS